jgi:hypothetical protein
VTWQIDLFGEDADIAEVAKLAPACECTIETNPNGRQCLTGPKFASLSDARDVRTEAAKVLNLLNGLARIDYHNHRPVELGTVSLLRPDGLRDTFIELEVGEVRARASCVAVLIHADGSAETAAPVDKSMERAKRVVADPKLAEIVAALSGDITLQRLRVAFEKVNALVGKGDNALVSHGYATQDELDCFKANVQDPRHGGLEAVHGVSRGPLKGTKMSTQEALTFVVRLFNAYLGGTR